MDTVPTSDVKPARKRTPANTRMRLLKAARTEFSSRGLEGARVDEIARAAGVNKQLVYHHFGNKDELYRHVLEWVYSDIRERERRLDLEAMEPKLAIRTFIEFSFDYLTRHRDFVAILTDENIHKGRHLKNTEDLRPLHNPLISALGNILDRGHRNGEFRPGIDPEQLYISIAGLSFFYFSNIHTLSAIFDTRLSTPAAIKERRAHVVEFVMNAIRA